MDRQTVTRARWAVTAVFFVNGSLLAGYLARIPSLKVEHRLDDGELGVGVGQARYVGLPLLCAGLVVTTWLLPSSAD